MSFAYVIEKFGSLWKLFLNGQMVWRLEQLTSKSSSARYLKNAWTDFNEIKYVCSKGSFIIYGLEGAAAGGGVKNFGRVAKGGRKILDVSRRGGEKFQTRP